MTAREDENIFNARFAFELLDLLFSLLSNSDEDECLLNKIPRKIRKIENFVDLVYECTDKEIRYKYTHTHVRIEKEKEREGERESQYCNIFNRG